MRKTRGTPLLVVVLAAKLIFLVAGGCSHHAPASTQSIQSTQSTAPQPTQRAAHAPQVELPFGESINHLAGLAVDDASTVYVTDAGNTRVMKLASETGSPTVLPLPDLSNPSGLAVDMQGNVYVTDGGSNQVLKLAAGASAATVLPFTGLHSPSEVAVDTEGSVYLEDEGNFRVLKLPVQ